MALTKDQKEKAAKDPGKNTGFWQDKPFNDDPNPAEDNLASEGSRVTAGRELPSETNDSAPKVVKRDPAPSKATSDPKSHD